MFNNIGQKIKGLALASSILGIIASILVGIGLSASVNPFLGLILAILGSFICWISSFVLYGFGELVDNSSKLVKMSDKGIRYDEPKHITKTDRITLAEKCRASGIINEIEYQELINNISKGE